MPSGANAPVFYGTYLVVLALAAGVILIPGVPLVPILVLSQVLNAVLLLPLLAFMYVIAQDRRIMGELSAGRSVRTVYLVCIAFIALCIGALAVLVVT